jgi:acetolactate synthase-1/3 small subunit
MSKTIHVELDRAEGSLLRIIGLIERRGFNIDGMVMEGAGDSRTMAIHVSPRDASRHVDVLHRQIDRLYGVRRFDASSVEEAVPCVA